MLIGLTGAIGGGKSTALAAFAAVGADTCDADRMCHALYDDPDLLDRLAARWGDIRDAEGRADRKKIAAIVFTRPDELAFLTGTLYPMLEARLVESKHAAERPGAPILVAEIPLLFESGMERLCDATAALWTGAELRHARLRSRGLSAEEIARREAKQWSESAKWEAADYGIVNTGSAEFLKEQCRYLVHIWEEKRK